MITYQTFKDPDPTQLLALYEDADWNTYTQDPEGLRQAVSNSWRVISAWDGELLVGLIRAVGDGFAIAYIQDILVRKSHQNLGIGSVLLKRMLEEIGPIRQTVLMTDADGALEWYQKRGFKRLDEMECVGLVALNTGSTKANCPASELR